MNYNFSRFSSGVWIAASAIIVLTLFYLFYVEIYMEKKEEAVVSTRFRVLDQMGKNISKRFDVLKQNAEDISKKAALEHNLGDDENIKDLLNKRNDINKNLTVKSIKSVKKDSTEVEYNKVRNIYLDAKQITFEIGFRNPKEPNKKDSISILTMSSSYEYLIEGLERKDIFNGILLINNRHEVVHNTLNQEIIITKGNGDTADLILEKEAATKADEEQEVRDFMKSEIGKIFSGEAINIKISNSTYKAFVKPIEVNNETWFAIGLMHKSKFSATIRSIEPWFVILLSILLIFIILGLPLVKLAVISKTEQLETSTIISSALSTFLGGSIIILFLFFVSQNYKRDSNIKSQLTVLSDSIKQGFLAEIKSAYTQMTAYEDQKPFDAIISITPYQLKDSLIKEDTVVLNNSAIVQPNKIDTLKNICDSIISANANNKSTTDSTKRKEPWKLDPESGLVIKNIFHLTEPFYPNIYPFGDYYFWVDKSGRQKAYLTPFKEFGNMSNLSSRDYVNKKDEWFLPNSTDKKFRLESIVSVSSGSVKAAISKPTGIDELPAIAISAKLTSIINTILPKDYEFCIIDKSGKVWFHSNENLNLKENFIEECNNDNELKSLLYANVANTLEVDYYNQKHKIHITPISNIPLHLVTMHNMKVESSFQAQVVTLTLTLLGFLLLLVFIQIVALLIIERKYRLALNRNLILKLTRPVSRLNGEYIYLFKLYLIVVLLMIPFLIIYEDLAAVSSIFTMVIIMFWYSYHILNQNELKKKHRKRFGQFSLVLLMIVTAVGCILLKDEAWWEILIFEGVLVFTIFLAHLFIRKEKQDITGYWKNYSYFFLTVLILFGIFPTLKFYELAYETEAEIRVRHLMYDFASQKEKRNLDIHNYFSKINVSYKDTAKIKKLYTSRKNSGIYVDMVHGLKFSDNKIPDTIDVKKCCEMMIKDSICNKKFIAKLRLDSSEEKMIIVDVLIDSMKHKKFSKRLIVNNSAPNKISNQVVIDTILGAKPSNWDDMIKFFRPYYDDYVVENKYLLHKKANNDNKTWFLTNNDRNLTLVYPSLTNNFTLDEIEYNAVSAQLPKLSLYLPFSFNGMREADEWLLNVLFWIMVGLLIYLFHALINFSISQIFTRRIITNFHYQDFSKILHQQKLANKDIIIYRLSRRDHSTTFRDDFIKTYGSLAIDTSSVEKMDKTQRNTDSLIRKRTKLSETEAQKPLTLLIDHFDMDFDNPDFFIQKMDIIRKYLKRSDIHLVIFSQVNPEKIQRYYRKETEKLAGEGITDNEGYKLQSEKRKNIINQLDELMIALLATPLPVLYHRPLKNIKKYCTEKPRRISDEDLIKGELSASDYLAHYEDALMTYKSDYIDAEKIKEGEDLIITKINTLADKYYDEIFESCTAEEKYVLFDMAHDQIVNPKNEAAINSLLRKGLLVKKCYKINFMNMSFRRFIMSKITKPEKLKIEAALGKPTGTWQNYRNALLLVIVALFIFIALANQDFLDNLNNLFVVLGGIIALVTSVLRMLSQKGKPVSE